MKFTKILIGLMVLCILGCNKDEEVNLDCLPSNLQNGVIAFYPFNGGSLLDESAASNDLTNPTSAVSTTDRNNNSDCAYLFDNRQPTEQFLTRTSTDFLNGLDTFQIYFNGILNESATGNAGCNNLQLAQDIGDFFFAEYFLYI